MVDGKLFDKLVSPVILYLCRVALIVIQEFIGRALRRNQKPFGGIQVSHLVDSRRRQLKPSGYIAGTFR
jgi:hypothetical protein